MNPRDAYEAARQRDKDRYHGGPHGSQTAAGGSIGMPDKDGRLYCVGCWWCEGSFEEWARVNRSAA